MMLKRNKKKIISDVEKKARIEYLKLTIKKLDSNELMDIADYIQCEYERRENE